MKRSSLRDYEDLSSVAEFLKPSLKSKQTALKTNTGSRKVSFNEVTIEKIEHHIEGGPNGPNEPTMFSLEGP